MYKVSTLGMCLLVLPIATGCGISKKEASQSGTKQGNVARVQSTLDNYASALNSSSDKIGQIVDKASAKNATEELTKSAKRIRELAEDLKSAGKLTQGEEVQLSTKGFNTANENFSKANDNVVEKTLKETLEPESLCQIPGSADGFQQGQYGI